MTYSEVVPDGLAAAILRGAEGDRRSLTPTATIPAIGTFFTNSRGSEDRAKNFTGSRLLCYGEAKKECSG
jgi:hypothetical protein